MNMTHEVRRERVVPRALPLAGKVAFVTHAAIARELRARGASIVTADDRFGRIDILVNLEARTQATIRALSRFPTSGGIIVNVSPNDRGIVAHTRALAKVLASRNVRVNGVSAGCADAECLYSSETLAEVARPVAFLASDEARFMMGATLFVPVECPHSSVW